MRCKHCNSTECVKNGFRNGKQNRKCKSCNRSFTIGDRRVKDREKEKAICLLLYTYTKASMRFLAKLFKVSVRTILLWLNSIADSITPKRIKGDIKEVEIDEMWHFVKKNVTSYGYLKHMTDKAKELLPSLQVEEILQQYKNYMIK